MDTRPDSSIGGTPGALLSAGGTSDGSKAPPHFPQPEPMKYCGFADCHAPQSESKMLKNGPAQHRSLKFDTVIGAAGESPSTSRLVTAVSPCVRMYPITSATSAIWETVPSLRRSPSASPGFYCWSPAFERSGQSLAADGGARGYQTGVP